MSERKPSEFTLWLFCCLFRAGATSAYPITSIIADAVVYAARIGLIFAVPTGWRWAAFLFAVAQIGMGVAIGAGWRERLK